MKKCLGIEIQEVLGQEDDEVIQQDHHLIAIQLKLKRTLCGVIRNK